MIEDSEQLNTSLEDSAAHLADRLSSYSFLGRACLVCDTEYTKAISAY